jgi:non-ribosomal peptide synthetase component F
MLAGPEGERLFEYWRQELDGDLPVLELPLDKPRPKVQTYDGELVVRVIEGPLAQQIQRLGERRGATLNMVLLAAYEMLLARYTGQDEILVGTPTSCRTRSELHDVIGYFVNPVVIRGDLSQNPTAAEFLDQIRSRMIGALEHQEYPFPLLVERLAPERDSGRPPVFQTMFAMHRSHVAKRGGLTPFLAGATSGGLDIYGMRAEPAGLEQRITPFDLSLTVSEGDDAGIALAMQYNTDLFERGTIERMLVHFENLLAAMADDDDRPVSELPFLSRQEEHRVLVEWNDTRRDYPTDVCLHELFEAQVTRSPDATAVVCRDTSLSYRELNQQANQLAHQLRRLGIGPEAAVGVSLPRSAEMIVALLGILKSGGSYVPIDSDLPTERKQFMIADAGIDVLVTTSDIAATFGDFTGTVVALDDRAEIELRSKANPKPLATPSNRAYVIYTSGSTGQPKGVEIEHASIVNYMYVAADRFDASPCDRMLQFASISFDTSAEEIFPTLARGAALVIRDEAMSLVPAAFLEECRRQ